MLTAIHNFFNLTLIKSITKHDKCLFMTIVFNMNSQKLIFEKKLNFQKPFELIQESVI